MAIAQRSFSDQVNDPQENLGFFRARRPKDDFEPPDREEHWSVLMQTIEKEIIPRLLLVRGDTGALEAAPADRWHIGGEFIEFITNTL